MDELMRLLAQLNAVQRGEKMSRPSASEIDRFLLGYAFGDHVMVERIEISRDDKFEFFMFAAWDQKTDELRLFTMWPRENAPMSEWT